MELVVDDEALDDDDAAWPEKGDDCGDTSSNSISSSCSNLTCLTVRVLPFTLCGPIELCPLANPVDDPAAVASDRRVVVTNDALRLFKILSESSESDFFILTYITRSRLFFCFCNYVI